MNVRLGGLTVLLRVEALLIGGGENPNLDGLIERADAVGWSKPRLAIEFNRMIAAVTRCANLQEKL